MAPETVLAEALHVVRNHAWDHSEHLHAAGGRHPLGNDITDEARAILSRLSDSGHILVEREALEFAIEFGHNLAFPGLGHTEGRWQDCRQPLCVRVRAALTRKQP